MSVTEAARAFSDLINRVRYRRESAVLLKGGKPVACIVPVKEGVPASDLADVWLTIPRLGTNEATAMAADIQESVHSLRLPSVKWD